MAHELIFHRVAFYLPRRGSLHRARRFMFAFSFQVPLAFLCEIGAVTGVNDPCPCRKYAIRTALWGGSGQRIAVKLTVARSLRRIMQCINGSDADALIAAILYIGFRTLTVTSGQTTVASILPH